MLTHYEYKHSSRNRHHTRVASQQCEGGGVVCTELTCWGIMNYKALEEHLLGFEQQFLLVAIRSHKIVNVATISANSVAFYY